MNITCPKAQKFNDDFCAPLLDKYRKNDHFVVNRSDGTKWFDIQLAMLNEHQTFIPIANTEKKIVGFTHKDYPQYVFADANSSNDPDHLLEIFGYCFGRFIDSDETTGIISYLGFNDVYAADDASDI